MPWLPEDAPRHTHKADTAALRRIWNELANTVLEDAGDEGRAVRTANGVVARNSPKSLAARLSRLIWRK
jgi:hypothetical protein